MKIAVLTYHSQNVNGNDYGNNDHVALASDLDAIAERGIPVVRLSDAVDAWLEGRDDALPPFAVALTCDDGTTLDWEDFEHPTHGLQTSFRAIVASYARRAGVPPIGLLTSFVIASPDARRQIDAGCYAGYPLSDERWWKPAQDDGLIDIENHSWDHLHPCVQSVAQAGQQKGDFRAIRCDEDAERQVAASADYIDRVLEGTGHRARLFAYPYGHVNGFLSRDYLPRCAHRHRMKAAFADDARCWIDGTHRFEIPRFVCGKAWTSPGELAALLDSV
jgi:hypothetical protein